MVQERERADPPAEGEGEPATEAATIRAYLAGETPTFQRIDGWIRAVLGRTYPRLADEHEDLSQIVHQKLLAQLRAGSYAGLSALRHYVAGIVHHVAIERLRELYRHRALSEAMARAGLPAGENPYGTIELRDRARLVHQLYHALPDTCRALWRLVFHERLAYDAIAERLDVPVGTVKSRMWYCRQKAVAIVARLRRLHVPRGAGASGLPL